MDELTVENLRGLEVGGITAASRGLLFGYKLLDDELETCRPEMTGNFERFYDMLDLAGMQPDRLYRDIPNNVTKQLVDRFDLCDDASLDHLITHYTELRLVESSVVSALQD